MLKVTRRWSVSGNDLMQRVLSEAMDHERNGCCDHSAGDESLQREAVALG